uniref:Uncharacterized protein LOC104228940 n=1 Tax=Nicotiana sylvestris TaxID=4096 RepID=A0A1U7WMI2_NICSY|nr:PREDICTED: uncharacterized protein LOC104228940 [Nicotiana sylvestris]
MALGGSDIDMIRSMRCFAGPVFDPTSMLGVVGFHSERWAQLRAQPNARFVNLSAGLQLIRYRFDILDFIILAFALSPSGSSSILENSEPKLEELVASSQLERPIFCN